MSKKSKHSTWLLSWDCNGLEAVINVDEYDDDHDAFSKKLMWDTLTDAEVENPKNSPAAQLCGILHALIMRARYNPQRHYEIYSIGMPVNTSKEDIEQMFEGSGAQMMVDLIREKGTKYFSDRANPEKVRII